ncbi:hypothetical protein DFH27DRAFT_160532 [Peziza echinospora]|nr:hypothetical protein DFH27DRAFT_160532 [Peziza echinospora]
MAPTAEPHPVADAIDKYGVEEIVRIVYITGYGPFRNILTNPSSQITSSLLPQTPLYITLTPTKTLKIIITPHPVPLRVAYADIQHDVTHIFDTQPFDYILHVGVGLAGGYKLETVAHGNGYFRGDVDGLVPGGEKAHDEAELKRLGLLRHWGGEWVVDVNGEGGGDAGWLGTGLDVDWICGKVRRGKLMFSEDEAGRRTVTVDDEEDTSRHHHKPTLPPITTITTEIDPTTQSHHPKQKNGYIIHPSTNAGRYLCEYIFRKSLEHAIAVREDPDARKPWDWRKSSSATSGEPDPETEAENISKRVLFMHVPNVGQPYSIEDGVRALEQVVVGMVLDGEGFRHLKKGK